MIQIPIPPIFDTFSNNALDNTDFFNFLYKTRSENRLLSVVYVVISTRQCDFALI